MSISKPIIHHPKIRSLQGEVIECNSAAEAFALVEEIASFYQSKSQKDEYCAETAFRQQVVKPSARMRELGGVKTMRVKTWFGLARSGEFYRVMVTNPHSYDEMNGLREKYCN
jgi:hypothetical protein